MTGIMQMFVAGGAGVAPGSQTYATVGTYSWVAPAGVTSVSVVVVGSGRCCGVAGALAYKNSIAVTPGNSYTVFISQFGTSRSYFINSCTVSAGWANNRTGDGGGNGANRGGAGGYSGNGGLSPSCPGSGAAGTGGAGGGGGFGAVCSGPAYTGGGGGVGLFGEGSSGAGGFGSMCNNALGGGGGSGGNNGGTSTSSTVGAGGTYGGGGGTHSCLGIGAGGGSAIRIVWPGATRSFPSTNVGSP
jgi:hypothetical protein